MEFTACTDFFCEELQSQYCAGLSYCARPEDKTLIGLLPTWLAEGKVVEGRAQQAMVKGAGGTET